MHFRILTALCDWLHSYLPSSFMPGRHLNLTFCRLASDQAERQSPWASCLTLSLAYRPMRTNAHRRHQPGKSANNSFTVTYLIWCSHICKLISDSNGKQALGRVYLSADVGLPHPIQGLGNYSWLTNRIQTPLTGRVDLGVWWLLVTCYHVWTDAVVCLALAM